jgi:hypothetical protein
MTEYEALTIEEAAYLMLRAVVDAGFGSQETPGGAPPGGPDAGPAARVGRAGRP